MSRLRRPFLSDRYFFITVPLLRWCAELTQPNFTLAADFFDRALHTLKEEPQTATPGGPR